MKKNLIVALALAFVLGIAGTAFAAANPFVDVPAKHWAYDAVSKLAQAGILDGYGDGTYRGERLATRYEMAQATAKAMARSDKANAQLKALIDKLAVEFAAELNNLGVRVAKLEKYASTIKFTGDARLRYVKVSDAVADKYQDIRIRLFLLADLNDKVRFDGRIDSQNRMYADDFATSVNDQLEYGLASFTFKNFIPNWNLSVGRNASGGLLNGVMVDFQYWDGAVLNYSNGKLQFMLGYGDARGAPGPNRTAAMAENAYAFNFWAASLKYDFSKEFRGSLAYLSSGANVKSTLYRANGTTLAGADARFSTFGVGLAYVQGDWSLKGEYFSNGLDTGYGLDRTSYMGRLQYKVADKTKVGSWQIWAQYQQSGGQSMEVQKLTGQWFNTFGNSRGWEFGLQYVPSKNVILGVGYQTLSAVNGDLYPGANNAIMVRSDWYF